MAVMRRPFVPPAQMVAGTAPQPGMPLPPQPGRVGAMPAMPMGGNPMMQGPQNAGPGPVQAGVQAAMQGPQAPGGQPPPPPIPPPVPGAGGPTAPANIGAMLQPQVQSQPLAPWGDAGTRPGGDAGAPGRMPLMPGATPPMNAATQPAPGGADDAAAQVGAGASPTVLMRLLKTMGKI